MYTEKVMQVIESPAFTLGSPAKCIGVTFEEVKKAELGTVWKHTEEPFMGMGGVIAEAKVIDKDDKGALIRITNKESETSYPKTELVYVTFYTK